MNIAHPTTTENINAKKKTGTKFPPMANFKQIYDIKYNFGSLVVYFV